jgi:hypothetical protein
MRGGGGHRFLRDWSRLHGGWCSGSRRSLGRDDRRRSVRHFRRLRFLIDERRSFHGLPRRLAVRFDARLAREHDGTAGREQDGPDGQGGAVKSCAA